MGVYSDGSYGQPEGLIYSFPVTCQFGKWKIVQVSSRSVCRVAREQPWKLPMRNTQQLLPEKCCIARRQVLLSVGTLEACFLTARTWSCMIH